MSSVLHPVGPEPPQTYWVRRALVVAVLLALVAVIIGLSIRGGGTVTAIPPPAVGGTQQPMPTSTTPAPSVTTTAKTPPPSKTAAPTKTAAAGKTTAPSKTPEPSRTQPPPVLACAPAKIRPQLTGDQRLAPKDPNTFTVSFVNGGGSPCRLQIAAKNYELKIYSGKDRIWSSKDCDTMIKSVDKIIKHKEAVTWTVAWNGKRSAIGCKNRPETPRPGTYFATSQLAGADPVQLRMILR